jgi:hypothetical protein
MESVSNTADRATEHVKEAASHARTTLLDLSTQILKLVNSAREAEGRGVDAVLDRLGLERRRSALAPALWFAAGALVGGTTVLLASPVYGKKLRERIASFIDDRTAANAKGARTDERKVEEVKQEVSPDPRPGNGAERQAG